MSHISPAGYRILAKSVSARQPGVRYTLRHMRNILRFLSAAGAIGLLAWSTTARAADPQKFGAGVSLETATPIASLVDGPAAFEGRTVRVEGVVSAVCTEMGCWMALTPTADAKGQTLRVKVDDGVIVFPVTAKGKRAVAQGVVQRVGNDPENREAAAEHARATGAPAADPLRNWQIKATGALVY